MKKSLLATLVAGIFLLSVGAFAGTVTISDIPDIIVVDDGQPSGTPGNEDFVFSQPFKFANYISTAGSTSTNPITVSYIVYDSSPTILSKLALAIEGVPHPMTTSGGQTAPAVLGTVASLDSILPNALFLEYVNTPPLVGSIAEYTRYIRLTGANGVDLPGTSPRDIGIYMDRTGTDRFSGVRQIFVDDFDSGIEGWIFTIAYGTAASATPGSAGGALTITYNNTMSYSYWRRPYGTAGPEPIAPLTSNKLYKVIANVTSSVAPTVTALGAYPDFRIYTGLANGCGLIWYLNSTLSLGGSNYISPSTTPRDYTIYFEATGAPVGGSSDLILQFEGYNFPYGGRPNFIGSVISLNRIELDELTYSIDAAGTQVHIVDDQAAQFALGSGTLNGWQNSDPYTGPGMPATTRGLATDNLGLVITSPIFASTDYFAYGAWDANPSLATSVVNFSGGALYRATFKVTTTHVGIPGTQNAPQAQVRIQTGDQHLLQGASLYSNFGSTGNKQLTGIESTTGPIELWFYYPSARTGTLAQKIFPSFEMLTFGPYTVYKQPSSAALTLRYYQLSQQTSP